MRFCSVVIAVSITAKALGYPTNLVKRISISTIGNVAGSEVTSGGKEVAGTRLDALTTAQTEGIASLGTSSRKSSTGIQNISNEDVRAASAGEENEIKLGGANGDGNGDGDGDGDGEKNNESQGLAQVTASENKPKSSSAEEKNSPSTTEAGNKSIQEVSIGGKKGVLVGGGQEANALANSFGANIESLQSESEVGKKVKNSEEAKAKAETEIEAEVQAEAAKMEAEAAKMEAEANKNGKRSSEAEAKEIGSTVQAEDANIGLVFNGKETPIDPGAVNSLSDIGKEIDGTTDKSDKNFTAVQIGEKNSNLAANNEKFNTLETEEEESKSGQVSTGIKFGVNTNEKEDSLGSNPGFNFKKEDTKAETKTELKAEGKTIEDVNEENEKGNSQAKGKGEKEATFNGGLELSQGQSGTKFQAKGSVVVKNPEEDVLNLSESTQAQATSLNMEENPSSEGQENDDSLNATAQASGGSDEEGSVEAIEKSDDDNNNGNPEEVKAPEAQEKATPSLPSIASNGQEKSSSIPPAQAGSSQEKVENVGEEAVATEKEKETTETESKPVEAQNIGQKSSSGENQSLAPQVPSAGQAGQAGQAKQVEKQAAQAGNES